jgi:hypothetical protein
MAEDDVPERLQPRMTRGVFRAQFVLWSIMAVLPLARLIGNLVMRTVWDLGDYLSLAMLILAVAYLPYLSHVRRHDGHFWEEEEARREEWYRRGRAL